MGTRAIGLLMLLSIVALTGCFGASDEVELTGSSAFDYMRKDLSTAPKTDVESIKAIMDWAVEDHVAEQQARLRGEPVGRIASSSRVEPSQKVMSILKKTTRPRKNFNPASFERIDFSQFAVDESDPDDPEAARLMAVDLSKLQNEFYIDNLDAIPVRNQGYRGTCAAFTGIGHLEYAAVQTYPNLSTIALSEQRYYYLSKPDCWRNGCSLSEEGSWYGTAMEASAKAKGPDIPLETDCPYNPQRGSNDLQTPQIASCATGALQVKSINYVRGAEQIIKALHDTRLPVPFASPLSANWERNKGLITHADSGFTGDTRHAGGHAYLIVGYKKLPNMPEEGGMCFVVKNSWGTGWGVNGYSCMTLKWMEEWTFGYQLSHPMAMQVLLREDLQGTEELPNNEEAEDESPPNVPDESEEPDTTPDETPDEQPEPPDVLPEPEPEPSVQWQNVKLFGPGESYYQAQIATDGSRRLVRALLKKKSGFSGALTLDTAGVELVYEGDRVGLVDGQEFYLCSGSYDLICSLRFDAEQNRLFIEFPNPDRRRVDEERDLPKGKWTGFDIPLGDYSFQVYEPDSLTSIISDGGVFFRMKKPGGATTEPVRLTSSGTEVRAMGETVGSLSPTNFGLCTGSFAKACSIFSSGKELNILPGW